MINFIKQILVSLLLYPTFLCCVIFSYLIFALTVLNIQIVNLIELLGGISIDAFDSVVGQEMEVHHNFKVTFNPLKIILATIFIGLIILICDFF